MPYRRQPARPPRRGPIAATAIVLAVVLGIVYLVTTKRIPLIQQQPTSCTAAADNQQQSLTVTQAEIAATIAGVAARRGLPARAVTIAYAAALQESKLTNPNYGDQDSLGIFQQRPSQGWGTPKQIMDPVYATSRFFAALEAVPGYLQMPVYQAAQAVQRSADGSAYDQYAAVGAQLAGAFTGVQPHAFWCYYASPPGKPRLAAADRALTSAFGDLRSHAVGDPAMAIRVRGVREGWAVAAWLIANADGYGIKTVRYSGYEWINGHGSGNWVRQDSSPRARAAASAVVFG